MADSFIDELDLRTSWVVDDEMIQDIQIDEIDNNYNSGKGNSELVWNDARKLDEMKGKSKSDPNTIPGSRWLFEESTPSVMTLTSIHKA